MDVLNGAENRGPFKIAHTQVEQLMAIVLPVTSNPLASLLHTENESRSVTLILPGIGKTESWKMRHRGQCLRS